MMMSTGLLATYLIGFIVFYLFEIQDTEKFSQIYLSTLDRHACDQEQERLRAKQIYTIVVFVGSIAWPLWMIRQLIQMSGMD